MKRLVLSLVSSPALAHGHLAPHAHDHHGGHGGPIVEIVLALGSVGIVAALVYCAWALLRRKREG